MNKFLKAYYELRLKRVEVQYEKLYKRDEQLRKDFENATGLDSKTMWSIYRNKNLLKIQKLDSKKEKLKNNLEKTLK